MKQMIKRLCGSKGETYMKSMYPIAHHVLLLVRASHIQWYIFTVGGLLALTSQGWLAMWKMAVAEFKQHNMGLEPGKPYSISCILNTESTHQIHCICNTLVRNICTFPTLADDIGVSYALVFHAFSCFTIRDEE